MHVGWVRFAWPWILGLEFGVRRQFVFTNLGYGGVERVTKKLHETLDDVQQGRTIGVADTGVYSKRSGCFIKNGCQCNESISGYLRCSGGVSRHTCS